MLKAQAYKRQAGILPASFSRGWPGSRTGSRSGRPARLVAPLAAAAVVISATANTHVLAGPVPGLASIGDLAGGPVASEALGISDNGQFVVGRSWSARGYEAARWSADQGLIGLGDLPGAEHYSFAWAVSEDGTVVAGGGSSTLGGEAFRWTASDGMSGLGDLPGGDAASTAFGVSGDGSVVVGAAWYGFGMSAPVLWSEAAGLVPLTDSSGEFLFGSAEGVTPDASVVVGYRLGESGYFEPFRWTEASGAVGLPLLDGAYFGFAEDVSPEGTVVVGSNFAPSGERVAFRWSQETGLSELGDLPGGAVQSSAFGTSLNGAVVVGFGTTEAGSRAFIWDIEHGMRGLDLVLAEDYGVDVSGWTLTVAYDVSADGMTIVGAGFNPEGNYSGWVAHLAVSIASANPPADNPYLDGQQPFRDVLQNTTAQLAPQGIGVPGTPEAGPVGYRSILVSLFAAPPTEPMAETIVVSCTDSAGNGSSDCPAVAQVSGSAAGPYEIVLTGTIPPGECMTIAIPGVAGELQYQSLPGDVSMNGVVNTQDLLALIRRLSDDANLPENLARYDIDRNGMADVHDLLRLIQMLNGQHATQTLNGVVVAACP